MPVASDQLDALLRGPTPILALAPMQEVTDGEFWTLVHRYGGADVYWTEYFRVHSTSTPEKKIVDAITRNTTGRPVVAQIDLTEGQLEARRPGLTRQRLELVHCGRPFALGA